MEKIWFLEVYCIVGGLIGIIYIFGVWKICENYMGMLLGVFSLFTNFLGIFLGLENGFITFCVQ